MTNLKTRLITDSKEIKLIGFYLDREKKITKQEPLGIVFNLEACGDKNSSLDRAAG
jgi:hypothetical protein